MNIMMLLMIHLCVKVRNKTQLIRGPDRYFTGKYICLILLTLIIVFIPMLLKNTFFFFVLLKILTGIIFGNGQTFNLILIS